MAEENRGLQAGQVSITADDREASGPCAARLRKLGVSLSAKRLPVADFVLSDRVGVERKTAADFESSVVDGRLFEQAGRLKAEFPSALLCVVGNDFSRLEKPARRGALIALATDFQLPVFFLESEESLADFLVQIATREQLSKKREMKLQFAKKSNSLRQQQQLIVESLPGVGPSTAKALLARFGSVENVLTADEEELLAAPGIGPEKARQLKKIVCGDYAPEKE